MPLGIIARCDNTGLGNQTRELVNLLKPDKILLINSHIFNKNEQFPQWYDGYKVVETNGVPKPLEIRNFLKGLDTVLSCETFYSPQFLIMAKKRKVKTILQFNYEFLDYLVNDEIPFPDMLISPSYWFLDEVKEKFKDKTQVIYLPPPSDHNIFTKNKEYNLSKDHKRILHIAGKKAAKDRNGTDTVINMLKHSKEDYELVIRTQSDLNIKHKDSRLTLAYDNVPNREDMYYGFDAMILPRRYAGLCLPMNESLLSGLPVFMTDVSPNNQVLPREWLCPSSKIDSLQARTLLDVYDADAKLLAKKVDKYIKSNKTKDKELAFNIGYKNYSQEFLKDSYLSIFQS